MIFEKKQNLAECLLEKGITLIYAADESPMVFVITEQMSGGAVKKVLSEEGYEIIGSARRGIFATAYKKETGYWCELQLVEEEESVMVDPSALPDAMCPVCQNEELLPGQKYCQICGTLLSGGMAAAEHLQMVGKGKEAFE